jgi:hypothetical protein
MSPDLADMIVGTHWTAMPSFSGKTLKTEMVCKEYPHLNTTIGGTLGEFVETDHPIFGFGGKSKVNVFVIFDRKQQQKNHDIFLYARNTNKLIFNLGKKCKFI